MIEEHVGKQEGRGGRRSLNTAACAATFWGITLLRPGPCKLTPHPNYSHTIPLPALHSLALIFVTSNLTTPHLTAPVPAPHVTMCAGAAARPGCFHTPQHLIPAPHVTMQQASPLSKLPIAHHMAPHPAPRVSCVQAPPLNLGLSSPHSTSPCLALPCSMQAPSP